MDSMIVCPEPLAAAIGESVYEAGGNAADAIVAAAFAQGVVNPMLCGIGGGGIMQVYDRETNSRVVLNCEVAIGSNPPPAEWVDQFQGRAETVGRFIISSEENQVGHRSVMLPGFVRGVWHLHQTYGSGKLSWSELIAPSIELARSGFEVYPYIAAFMTSETGGDATHDRPGYPNLDRKIAASADGRRTHTKTGGNYYTTGDWLVQSDYASTLQRIAEAGADDFYAGDLGATIADDFERNGGLITREDLRNYAVEAHAPIPATYRGYEVSAPPLASTGPQLIELLNILEHFDLAAFGHNTAGYIDLFARIQRATFADTVRLRCTEFEYGMAIAAELTAPERAAYWANRIDGGDRIDVVAGSVKPGTTHVTAVDRDRNAITFTHSTGSIAGSGVMTPGLGFFYNNFLGQYNPVPGHPDSIAPGKRFGGGIPALFFKDGEPVLAIGAPGGSRIITSVCQAIINALDFGMDMTTAVSVPRFHSEEGQLLYLEPNISDSSAAELEALGNTIRRSSYMSRVQAIGIAPSGLVPGADPRGGAGVGHVHHAS
jgi:gamma-glutamyltranspeptidase/glutathione hydrolase